MNHSPPWLGEFIMSAIRVISIKMTSRRPICAEPAVAAPPLTRLLKTSFLIIVAFALSFQLTGCEKPQTPEALFREAVRDPIPASVQFINATRHSRAGDVEIWLHFKIAPADFDTLFMSDAYKNLGPSSLNYSAYGPPGWWAPEKLGLGLGCFSCETKPHFGRDRSAKDMVVSAKQDEVLFLLRSWYND
jgi:hypothetical protein